jgi:hypothetical protein
MLKELEDYNWFPMLLRKFQLEFIGSLVKWFALYKPLVPVIKDLSSQAKAEKITDLCSGSGEPAVYMQAQLGAPFTTKLTDKYPLVKAMPEDISYETVGLDVLELQPEKGTLYTMYNAFHHFGDAGKEKILQNFSNNAATLLIAEILAPDLFTLLNVFFSGTAGQLLLAPFIRPFSLWRLLFTYIIPVNIFTVTYDGIISVIRSKTLGQYEKIAQRIGKVNYKIEVMQFRRWYGKVTYITAKPHHD